MKITLVSTTVDPMAATLTQRTNIGQGFLNVVIELEIVMFNTLELCHTKRKLKIKVEYYKSCTISNPSKLQSEISVQNEVRTSKGV